MLAHEAQFATLDVPRLTVLDSLVHLAETHRNRIALIASDGQLTFGEWLAGGRQVAAALETVGIEEGDCVGMILDNGQARAFTVVLTGSHLVGALAVPLNPRIGPSELSAICGQTRAKVWFVADRVLPRLAGTLLSEGEAELVEVHGGALGDRALSAFLSRGNGRATPGFCASPNTPCTVAYTSGTTGTPKGVLWSHELLRLCADRMSEVLGETYTTSGLTDRDVIQSPLPIFTGTMMANFLNVTMSVGCPLVLEDRFDPRAAEGLVERWGTTIYNAVPSIFALWGSSCAPSDHQIRCLVMSGAPIAPALVRSMHERWPNAVLMNLYGTVEGGAAMIVNAGAEMLRFPTAVGRPVPPTAISIRNGDEDVEPGNLYLQSPGMMLGYLGDPEATTAKLKDGWLQTHDVAMRGEEGVIYLLGRIHETVNRGGFKIMPGEVEQALELHPDIDEAAVIGIEHPVLGEDLAAAVVLRSGSCPSADKVARFLRGVIADYKVPRTIRTVDALPRNHHGKLDRTKLRRLFTG